MDLYHSRRLIHQINGKDINILYAYFTNKLIRFILPIYRYSSRSLLNKLDLSSKYKSGNYILNYHQKPILLFMKYIYDGLMKET